MRVLARMMDCGAAIGIGVCVGRRRWAWRLRNPFFRWDVRKGEPR